MTQDNVPRDLHEQRFRVEDGDLSDEEFELIDVLENVVDEVLGEGESDDEAEEEMEDVLAEEPTRDDSLHSHSHHRGSVFVCDIHPDGKTVASGGEDDRLLVTDISTGNILLDCNDYFQDSVTMVGYNHDGKYLAACDMMGQLSVWKCTASGLSNVLMEKLMGISPSSWSKWHPKSNVLLIGGHSTWLYKIPSVQCKLIHEGTTETDGGGFMPDGKRAVIGFEDGTIKVFDLATGCTTCKFSPESTQLNNILSIAIHPDNNLIAAGSMNSKLAIFKTQQPKTVAVLDCEEDRQPINDDGENIEDYVSSTEAVVFISVEGMNVLVVGTDYTLHIWDYTRLALRHKIFVEEGITRILWPENSLYLFVGTRKGSVNIYNPLSGAPHTPLEGHRSSILDMTISTDKKRLVTAGDDGSLKVFDITQFTNT